MPKTPDEDMTLPRSVLAVILYTFGLLALGVLVVLFTSWIMLQLWTWFFVSWTHFQLTWLDAIGIELMRVLMWPTAKKSTTDDETGWERMLRAVSIDLCTLLIGWAIHVGMH